MQPDDDRIVQVVGSANPARTPIGSTAGPREETLLRSITTDRLYQSHRRPITLVLTGAVAATIAIVTAVVGIIFPFANPPASAITPEPLQFTDPMPLEHAAQLAMDLLALADGVDAPTRESRSLSWSFVRDVTTDSNSISPRVTQLNWDADLSGEMRVVAGEPIGQDNGTTPPGEELMSMRFAAGEFSTPVIEQPGDSRSDVLHMLQSFGLPDEPTSADVIDAAVSVLDQWTLTNEQHGQLLGILIDTGDVSVLGLAIDRAERPVIGFAVDDQAGAVRRFVLVSATSGRIVGVESLRLTADEHVPAGAVISYRLWESPPEDERKIQ